MTVAALPAYVERVGIYRDLNAACLGLAPPALAGLLLRELEAAGALRRDGDSIVPVGAR